MPVTIVGNHQQTKRIITGLRSFDYAFENLKGDIGFPLGTMTELFGPTGCGKSTLTFGLSGILAKQMKTQIALVDFEGFDPDFMVTILENSGFDGKVFYIQDKSDEKTLDGLIDQIKDECGIGIVDSIGAISPIQEAEGELGEANMGRRAKLVAQLTRKTLNELRKDRYNALFMINHVHPVLGGMGTTTPGGETLKYLTGIRLRVKRKEEFPDQSYVMEGIVVKNRFGYRNRQFYIFMLSGTGIHVGLTAMYDCFILGLAERGKVVKMDGKSHGYLKDLVKAAHEGNNEVFQPFIDKVSGASAVVEVEEENNTEE
jgi:RecA/RadA recombinase